MRRIATAIIIIALVIPTLMWIGERFDASPTMQRYVTSDASNPTERNQP